jgi:GNAT superfamily N-acetyltransferase
VERGERLPSEPWLAVVPPPSPRAAAVVAFPGLVVVAAAVEQSWVHSWVREDDLSGPLNPVFLGAVEERLRLMVNNVDVVVMAAAAAGDPPLPLELVTDAHHPRVVRAHRHRTDVRVWAVEGGLLVLGRGLAGRWEAAIEVDRSRRNNGLGRALATAARHLVPEPGRPVWAQIAPGNAASLRAFTAAGFQAVGAEALLVPPVLPDDHRA